MGELAIPLAIGSSLFQFGQRASAAKSAEIEAGVKAQQLELEAEQEEVAAISREADRKQDLARALASQFASAGAGGIQAFSGSPLTILEADIASEEKATQRDRFQTDLAKLTKKASAASVRRTGKFDKSLMMADAGLGLVGDLTEIAESA